MTELDIYTFAKETAMKRLDRRECSSLEIHNYLIDKGVTEEVVTQVVEELKSREYIHDGRYARMYVRSQTLKSKGPHFIRQKLTEKGIRLELNEIKELSEEVSKISEAESAKLILERKYPNAQTDRKETQRAINGLLRRGFSYSVIQSLLSR